MATTIRLQRGGSTHNPVYRLVVTDSRSRRDGRFVEKLGTYAPKAVGKDVELAFNLERIDYWLSVGAQQSDTARALIKKARKLAESEAASSGETTEAAETAAESASA